MKINGWPAWLRVNDQLNATSLVAVVVTVFGVFLNVFVTVGS